MSKQISINGIGQIAIAISDLEKSINFYQNILNLELLFQAPPGLAFFKCGEVRLMLTTLQGEETDHNTSVIYYKIDGIEEVFKALKTYQVAVERAPQMAAQMEDHELWIGFIRDPDSNLVGLMEEKPLT